MRLRNFGLTVFSAALALGFGIAAHATTITAIGSSIVANGGQAPGSALNYDFFGWQGSPASVLTNYTVSTGGAAIFGGGNSYGYTTLIAPGGTSAFYTGIDYSSNLAATFSPLANGDFYVWVLDGNSDGNALGNANIGLSVNGGSQVTIATTAVARTNEFSEFLVTGASAGDVFQVYANTTGARPSIGGISFGAVAASPVPEPGSLVLLGTGILGVLGVARRRFFRA